MAAMSTTTSWPPSCHSAPSNCTCCCILTPHTHLSDAAGYPHLNHIIRFPQPDTDTETLAWFHCPHCPCTLGIMWVHPNEMLHAEESVSTASWLPRMADFEAYGRCFDDGSGNTSVPQSPMEDVVSMSTTQLALADRKNGTNVPEGSGVTRKSIHRKSQQIDGTRKSARKSKPSAARLESGYLSDLNPDI